MVMADIVTTTVIATTVIATTVIATTVTTVLAKNKHLYVYSSNRNKNGHCFKCY